MTVEQMIERLQRENPKAIVVRRGRDHAYIKIRGIDAERAQQEDGQIFEADTTTWAHARTSVVVIG